ncbi:MAG: hypothetical protein ABF443_14220 [Acetobacter malorum]|uniref:hypothetical protein n=1 Tax=Acetobacter malorum TaxID=178901 RepID=UPI0039E802B7
MSTITTFPGNAVAAGAPELSADLSAVADAVQRGVPMLARDLTPKRVAEARAVVAAGLGPATPVHVASWLKSLGALTVNAPDGRARAAEACAAILEVCGDMPAAVWCPETRRAWVKHGERGKFWPAPAELYAHLLPYAEKLRRDVAGCRKIVALAERAGKRTEGVSEEERKAVAAQMAAWRKTMGHEEPRPVRRPVVAQASVSERLAAYRVQLRDEPEAGAWILPLIAQLEAQVGQNGPKGPRGLVESAAKALQSTRL